MLKRTLTAIAATLCFSPIGLAQVPSPKHESHLHHLFGSHSDADNLPQRVESLKCALVLIRTPNGFGTGFFINHDGDIATASHVLGDRTYTSQENGTMKVDLVMPASFTVVHGQSSTEVPATDVEKNGDAWGADVAVLKSGIRSDCWLATAPDASITQGEHLITLGFPGLAWGSLSIYTGIMSAHHRYDEHETTGEARERFHPSPNADFYRIVGGTDH